MHVFILAGHERMIMKPSAAGKKKFGIMQKNMHF